MTSAKHNELSEAQCFVINSALERALQVPFHTITSLTLEGKRTSA
jgi:hypothetical protein